MEFESEKKLKEFILAKGCFDEVENLRIYGKYFRGFHQREELLHRIFDFGSKKVLDVGCSYGRYLIHFSQDSVGVEIQPRLVKFAKSLGLCVILADIEEYIPVDNSSFDVVFCHDVLEHMVSPHKVLVEFQRILRPDGALVLDVRNMDGVCSKHWDYPAHLYAFNKKSVTYLLKRAGFRIQRYIVLNQRLSKIINPAIYEKLLAKFMPALCVVAEKIPE